MTLPVTPDHVLAVDLGGSNIRAALCDLAGGPAAEARAATVDGDAAALLTQLAGMSRDLAADVGVNWARIAGMAVGVPGVVMRDGSLGLAPNLTSFADLDFAARLRESLGVPVAVDNDVNLATLAEQRHGLGTGVADFVFIAVGTGVGMGIVSSGRVQRGATGAAGEIAYLPVGADPFDADHHARGSLEQVAGGGALVRRYAAIAGRSVTAHEVFDRAADGDAGARAVIDDQARAIALAVLSTISILDPELVAFGGGIGSREDFVAGVREHLARLTPRTPAMKVSRLGERAGLIGAAELARAHAASDGAEEASVHD